jgi:hypothetical protein
MLICAKWNSCPFTQISHFMHIEMVSSSTYCNGRATLGAGFFNIISSQLWKTVWRIYILPANSYRIIRFATQL